MSEFKSSSFRNEDNSGAPDIVGVTSFTSPFYFVPPSGTTAQRPSGDGIAPGMLRFNTDIGRLEVWRGDHWATILGQESASIGGRAVSAGGVISPAWVNTIEYITIQSTGNSIDFGDLTVARGNGFGGCGSSTRGVFGGGGSGNPGSVTFYNTIDYITIAVLGNAIDFGDLTTTRQEMNGCSDATRGVWGGGEPAQNTIDYVTIASTGNATDFGDLFSGRYGVDALEGRTRGIFYGGSNTNIIEYITFQSTGNAVDFGDMTVGRRSGGDGFSNSVRGLMAGGFPTNNVIDYITISTLGNATDFGDLLTAHYWNRAANDATRGVWMGNHSSNTIQFVTIATLGNAQDFGDLLTNRKQGAACSNAHGGL
jgi:hypothetical protein